MKKLHRKRKKISKKIYQFLVVKKMSKNLIQFRIIVMVKKFLYL